MSAEKLTTIFKMIGVDAKASTSLKDTVLVSSKDIDIISNMVVANSVITSDGFYNTVIALINHVHMIETESISDPKRRRDCIGLKAHLYFLLDELNKVKKK